MILITRSFLLQLSILVHPDKNQDDADRAQKAFEGNALILFLGWCMTVVGLLFFCSWFKCLLGVEAPLTDRRIAVRGASDEGEADVWGGISAEHFTRWQ